MIKKFFVGTLVVLFSMTSLAFIMPVTTVSAIDCVAETEKARGDFLSFPSWSRGFPLEPKTDPNTGEEYCVLAESAFEDKELGPIIFTIALNIIDMALRLAGIIAVGFVIWGGFHYTMSHGEPEQAKKSMDIIRSSLIGLVITMIAAVVVSFVVSRLAP